MSDAKLVFVNRYFHPDQSATSRLLSDLAFRLSAAGIRVAVVTSRQLYDDPTANLPARECVAGVDIHRVATSRWGRGHLFGRGLDYLSFHMTAALRLLRLLSSADVVVAKTDPPLISIIVSHVARLRGALLVNWLQDVFPEIASALDLRAIPTWFELPLQRARDRSLQRAAMNIVLGRRMRERLLKRDIDPARIMILPNWADVRQLTPRPVAQSRTRVNLGLGNRFVVGYAGNLGRAHEFDTLLGAARLLRDDTEFAFLVSGGGAKLAALRHAIDSERLRNFCLLPHQPVQFLGDCLAASDIHVVSLLPALEGLIVPSKFYGVLAAGRPTIFIGDPQGEVATILQESDCGITVVPGASETLARELQRLRASPQRLAEMGRNARELAVARYASERAASDWCAMLNSLALPVPCPSPEQIG